MVFVAPARQLLQPPFTALLNARQIMKQREFLVIDHNIYI